MIAWIVLVGFFLGHSGQKEDAALKVRRAAAIGKNNLLVIVGPVGGRGNGFLVAELQGFDAAHNFVHVATHAGRIVQTQHEFVFRIDDKDRANREGQLLLTRGGRINHAVGRADGTVGITNNGKFHLDFVFAVSHHVLQPVIV